VDLILLVGSLYLAVGFKGVLACEGLFKVRLVYCKVALVVCCAGSNFGMGDLGE
jgi:hypothetical protein